MNDPIISIRNVSKHYQVFKNARSRLLHAIFPHYPSQKEEIRALKNITLDIQQGEAVAIIGRNGGGKSTLLEILSGTLLPTSGEIFVNGRVSALLELGSGFHPDYTGRDNVIVNGLLLGLSKTDIVNRFSDIESFADIGTAIHRPVKTYSTGMVMRLAFAVQVLCDPNILIIDEALGVGDFFFQQKCFRYIQDLHRNGTTLLFVSHDMGTVRELCSRVIYLKRGDLIFDGLADKGIRLFFNETAIENTGPLGKLPNNKINPTPSTIDIAENDAIWTANHEVSFGQIHAVALFGLDGVPKTSFRLGETMMIRIKFLPDPRVVNHVGVVLYDKFGAIRTTTGSKYLKVTSNEHQQGFKLFELQIKLMIEAGQYGLKVTLGYATGKNIGERLDETDMLGPIIVHWDYEKETAPFLGQVGLPVTAQYLN